MGFAKDIYAKIEVGAIGSCGAGVSGAPKLEDFQGVVAEFETLAEKGVLEITDIHRESHSGQHYVDLVQFRKLN